MPCAVPTAGNTVAIRTQETAFPEETTRDSNSLGQSKQMQEVSTNRGCRSIIKRISRTFVTTVVDSLPEVIEARTDQNDPHPVRVVVARRKRVPAIFWHTLKPYRLSCLKNDSTLVWVNHRGSTSVSSLFLSKITKPRPCDRHDIISLRTKHVFVCEASSRPPLLYVIRHGSWRRHETYLILPSVPMSLSM
jgi:hypothetical protein